MKKSNYVITAPYSQQGGVASFVNSVKPYLKGDVNIFRRGKSVSKSFFKNIEHIFTSPARFKKLLKNDNAENILINTSLCFMLMLRDGILVRISKNNHRKVILVIHGFREKDLKFLYFLKWGYWKADRIMVLANDFKNLLINKGCPCPIDVFLNPIDENVFEKIVDNPINNNISNILFLSRLEKDKGLFESLKCFQILKEKYHELVLNIVGDGSAKKDAELYVSDNGIKDVVFHGFLTGNEKIELLNNSQLLLFPTCHKEGLPISILEAMAAGNIVFTRATGGIKDLYEKCNFGVMIESVSPKDFADEFDRLYQNPILCRKIRENNQSFAKRNFHPSIISSKIKDLFDLI